jgi:hypothetical protein
VDDPAVSGAARPIGAPPPVTFDHRDFPPSAEGEGGPWRCRACYAGRFKTMCFGMNESSSARRRSTADAEPRSPGSASDAAKAVATEMAGTAYCVHCGKSMDEAGWSIWLPYEQLPAGPQATVTRRYGPKILATIQTKWPHATLTHDDTDVSDALPSV